MDNNNIGERKANHYKRRIVIVVLSMLLCMLLIGISVYAAVSQTSTVENTITINSSKQVRVGITVSYANGAAEDARTLFDNSAAAVTAAKALTFTSVGTKASNEDSKNLTAAGIEFSYDNKYTYRVYKIEFENTAASDITYSIAFQNTENAAYTFSSQVSVYSGKSSDETLSAGQTVSGELAASGDETIYIVVAMNTALIDATPVAQSTFKMVITANQKSGS